jgi:hypothetical protein
MTERPRATTNGAAGVDDNYAPTCEVCGVALIAPELHEVREFGRPALCTTHLAEQIPAEDLQQAADDDAATAH